MSRSIPWRLLASSPLSSFLEATSSRTSSLRLLRRPFTQSSQRRAEDEQPAEKAIPSSATTPKSRAPSRAIPGNERDSASALENFGKPRRGGGMEVLSDFFQTTANDRAFKNSRRSVPGIDPLNVGYGASTSLLNQVQEDPHHFHIFATRHNTHITLTKPNRDPLMSFSCGNIGFRKSGRKHYDSAFQLAAYVMGRIQEQGINNSIKKLEVVCRGFGAGREAVVKALLGTEGRLLRDKVVRVTDATRLKFGGTRSPKPRRLG